MKQTISFKLSVHSIMVLSIASAIARIDETEIMERTLQAYFEKESVVQHSPLMVFAGILSNDDADDMLEAIYISRIDTERDVHSAKIL